MATVFRSCPCRWVKCNCAMCASRLRTRWRSPRILGARNHAHQDRRHSFVTKISRVLIYAYRELLPNPRRVGVEPPEDGIIISTVVKYRPMSAPGACIRQEHDAVRPGIVATELNDFRRCARAQTTKRLY